VASDATVLLAADHDPEHRRRFDFPDDFVPSLRHSQNVIARWAVELRGGQRFPFAVRHARTGELLGGCELAPRAGAVANLSYWTHPAHRRRGVASRAVVLACHLAFNGMGFQHVEVAVEPDNVGSRRVAEATGFTEVGNRDSLVLFVRTAEAASHGDRPPTGVESAS
jgi:RimJ/RimL family protein N-acetyltransferase